MTSLSKQELERYSRHLILPKFGLEAQEKLKNSSALVVGAGGLGAPVLQYLAAAGVGTIGIVDFDVVEDSNLQRQVLFTTEELGKSKAESAARRLQLQNPHIHIRTYVEKLTSENALEIIKDYDVIIDGTDNFPTRYLVNDACVILGKPNVYGSIYRFEGQASVFNFTNSNGVTGPNYRDLYPTPPPPEMVPSCAEGGVLGVLPGIIGSIQANEAIKVLSGVGTPLSGQLLLLDTFHFQTRTIKIHQANNAPEITELIDYQEFCGIKSKQETTMKEVTVKELAALKEEGADFQLIDVRESHEVDIVEIGGELIPLDTIPENVDKIARDKQVIVHCRSGVRSGNAIKWLEQNHGFENLYNLKGGVLAYADEIDNSLAKY